MRSIWHSQPFYIPNAQDRWPIQELRLFLISLSDHRSDFHHNQRSVRDHQSIQERKATIKII